MLIEIYQQFLGKKQDASNIKAGSLDIFDLVLSQSRGQTAKNQNPLFGAKNLFTLILFFYFSRLLRSYVYKKDGISLKEWCSFQRKENYSKVLLNP